MWLRVASAEVCLLQAAVHLILPLKHLMYQGSGSDSSAAIVHERVAQARELMLEICDRSLAELGLSVPAVVCCRLASSSLRAGGCGAAGGHRAPHHLELCKRFVATLRLSMSVVVRQRPACKFVTAGGC